MIGSRLKLIRQAHGLSLQDLANQIAQDTGVTLHRTALFGYENERTEPNEHILEILAQELGVPKKFFFQEEWNDFSLDLFFCPKMVAQRQMETEAIIQVKLERYRYLDHLLNVHTDWEKPERRHLKPNHSEEVEQLADEFRQHWQLGIYPVSSVCGLLESMGWHLLLTPNNLNRAELNGNEVCGLELSEGAPFILYSSSNFPDEIRYKLLKYMGYAYLEGDTEEETERLVAQFARAILCSRDQVYGEVGTKRNHFTEEELAILKQKYGMPRRCFMRRFAELGVISQEQYQAFKAYLWQNLFLKRENFMQASVYYENPTAYDLKLIRARSEGLLPEGTYDDPIMM